MFKNVLKTIAVVLGLLFIFINYASADDNATKKSNVKVNKNSVAKPVFNRTIVIKQGGRTGTFDEDYYIGLKAYEDGFLDVAKDSLKVFLEKDSKSDQAGFAIYILYQVYMNKGDYQSAKYEFEKLKSFNDPRFDRHKLDADEMTIAANTDCKGAKKLLFSKHSDDLMMSYIKSGCEVSQDILDYVASTSFSTETVVSVINKIKDDKSRMLAVYNNLSIDKKTPKLLNFYGHYFAYNKMNSDFWKLYKDYKDSDMVNLALDNLWNQGNNNNYLDFFNKNVSGFSLDNVAYCRYIEAANKTGKKFDCQMVDGCINSSNPQYNKTKLACYIKNQDRQGISLFMNKINSIDASGMCQYAKYIVIKDIYSNAYLGKFSLCQDKSGMYEALLKYRDYKGVMNLAGKTPDQTDYAYLSIAYYRGGNKAKSKLYLQKLADQNLIKMVKSRISSGN